MLSRTPRDRLAPGRPIRAATLVALADGASALSRLRASGGVQQRSGFGGPLLDAAADDGFWVLLSGSGPGYTGTPQWRATPATWAAIPGEPAVTAVEANGRTGLAGKYARVGPAEADGTRPFAFRTCCAGTLACNPCAVPLQDLTLTYHWSSDGSTVDSSTTTTLHYRDNGIGGGFTWPAPYWYTDCLYEPNAKALGGSPVGDPYKRWIFSCVNQSGTLRWTIRGASWLPASAGNCASNLTFNTPPTADAWATGTALRACHVFWGNTDTYTCSPLYVEVPVCFTGQPNYLSVSL